LTDSSSVASLIVAINAKEFELQRMRGLFTFACFVFLLPTIIATFLWCYLAFALMEFVCDVVGEVMAWFPSHLLQVAILAWLAIMLACYVCRLRMFSDFL